MSTQPVKADDPATSIAPLLSVRNGARALEFYKAAFGARELFRVDNEKGEVVARLAVQQAEFWVADESPENQNFSPESLGGGSVRMVMIVPDPDAAVERAVQAGAKVVWPVSEEYGWRLGRIADPFGHHWEIGRPLAGSWVRCVRAGEIPAPRSERQKLERRRGWPAWMDRPVALAALRPEFVLVDLDRGPALFGTHHAAARHQLQREVRQPGYARELGGKRSGARRPHRRKRKSRRQSLAPFVWMAEAA